MSRGTPIPKTPLDEPIQDRYLAELEWRSGGRSQDRVSNRRGYAVHARSKRRGAGGSMCTVGDDVMPVPGVRGEDAMVSGESGGEICPFVMEFPQIFGPTAAAARV